MARTLYKPSGIPVFPMHSDPTSDCMQSRLLLEESWRGDRVWPEGFAAGIAHRLDIPTSGALWVADDPEELSRMRAAFASGALRKTYRFWAGGEVPWNDNQVDRPLAHDRRKKKRMVVQRGPNTPHRGRWHPASTRFRRIEGSLWEAVMKTGVMHQIRAHAAFIGLGLAGDPVYGRGELPSGAPAGSRFLLHHVGLEGGGYRTDPVELPAWASSAAQP